MSHRSVIAAVLGVGFILAAAGPAAADPWGRGGPHGYEHRGYEHRGYEHRGYEDWGRERWARERWEHRHRPYQGYYGYAPSAYAPNAYYAPPAVYLGLPGFGLRIR